MHLAMTRDEISESDWMQGFCHAHAMACVLHHGGFFVAVRDSDGSNEDDILHVLSAHQTDMGLLVRDAAGEALYDDIADYLDEIFPGRCGEIMEMGESGIRQLIAQGYLRRISEKTISEAGMLESVTRCPGEILQRPPEP